jgi:hypothetical protein
MSVRMRGMVAVSVWAGMGMGVLPAAVAMALPVERLVLERRGAWHLLQD